jgi:glycosyl transferase family 87
MLTIDADALKEDRGALRLLAWAGGIFVVLTAINYVWTISWTPGIPRDATTLVVGRDFLNFWMPGVAAWMSDPGRFYDPQIYHDALSAFLGPDYPGQNWTYPPGIMLVMAPLGRLPYLAALGCWTVLGLAVFVWVLSRSVEHRWALVPILLSPAVLFCLICGQVSLFTAAMLLTILAGLDRRPLLAGVLIGVLTLKPQLGLLFPVLLAASGRWRVFVTAAVTGLAIAAAATVVLGAQVWSDFVLKGLPVQNLILDDPLRLATLYHPTIFTNLHAIGMGYGAAMAVQACFAAFGVGAVFFAYRFRRDADPRLLAALFLACSICAVPYFSSYDAVAITCVAVMLLETGKLDAPGRVLAKLVYFLPVLQIALGTWHIPGPALIPPAFAAYLLMRLIFAGETVSGWALPFAGRRAANMS